MSEPHRFLENMGTRASDRFLFLLTMSLTVLADLTVAIAVGVAIGLALRTERKNIPPSDWTPPER